MRTPSVHVRSATATTSVHVRSTTPSVHCSTSAAASRTRSIVCSTSSIHSNRASSASLHHVCVHTAALRSDIYNCHHVSVVIKSAFDSRHRCFIHSTSSATTSTTTTSTFTSTQVSSSTSTHASATSTTTSTSSSSPASILSHRQRLNVLHQCRRFHQLSESIHRAIFGRVYCRLSTATFCWRELGSASIVSLLAHIHLPIERIIGKRSIASEFHQSAFGVSDRGRVIIEPLEYPVLDQHLLRRRFVHFLLEKCERFILQREEFAFAVAEPERHIDEVFIIAAFLQIQIHNRILR
mmetsp:Transcript_58804/g.97298  ORF Transcript_58804/g.97298 Transcript_58804/m.97298 type:complete len:295 (+) Transcript_58804:411-1295(+)